MLSRFSVLSAALICIALAVAEADSPATMPSTLPTTTPSTISWDQAGDHIGQTVTVVGPVVGSHDFGGAAVLNVGKNYPDPDRFTVYIRAEKRAGIPDDLYVGKTISVTGTLKIFKNAAEIQAGSADIIVVKQADAPATTAP
jgi:hypothetical protein